MTIQDSTSRITFAGNGTTTSFDTTPVVFYDDTDLKVYVVDDATGDSELLVLDTDYAVAGGEGDVGTVDLSLGADPYGAPGADTTLLIVRELPSVQEFDPEQNDLSDADALEQQFDKTTILIQQLKEIIEDRTVRLAEDDISGVSLELPLPEASQFLRWNDDGTALENHTLLEGAVTLVAGTGITIVGTSIITISATSANSVAFNAITAGTAAHTVTNTGVMLFIPTVPAGANTAGHDVTLKGGPGSATNAAGGVSTLQGGTGAGTGNGGIAAVTGGTAGATGAGGAATITGGTPIAGAGGAVTIAGAAGVGTSKAGGALTLSSGAGTSTTGVAGALTISVGASFGATAPTLSITGGATSASGGTGGPLTLTAGAGTHASSSTGGAASLIGGAATAGIGGAGNVTAGAGGGANAGGVATLKGGVGGSTGAGGAAAVTGGAAGGGNTNGGSVILTPGAKAGTGLDGNILFRTGAVWFKQSAATTDNGDTPYTLTAAEMLGGISSMTPTTGRAVTTLTGAQIDAAVSTLGLAADDAFEFSIQNRAAFAATDDIITLTAGASGVTITGSATIAPGMTGRFRARRTGSATYVIHKIAG